MYDFKLLKPVSNVVDVLGRIVICIAVIAGVLLIFSGETYNMIIGAIALLGGGILGLLIILISQLVNLFLQIEENTRKQL
jgi:hypothetical protein